MGHRAAVVVGRYVRVRVKVPGPGGSARSGAPVPAAPRHRCTSRSPNSMTTSRYPMTMTTRDGDDDPGGPLAPDPPELEPPELEPPELEPPELDEKATSAGVVTP